MFLKYTAGPPRLDMGAAGIFEINIPREIPDGLADQLLEKTSIKFEPVGAIHELPLHESPKFSPNKSSKNKEIKS